MRPLIVNIHAHTPPYAFASDHERPDVVWEKPDGTWLGLWAREWPDLLGEAILRADSGFRWEVWQPDYRADRIYSQELSSGVMHRLFPATEREYCMGIGRQRGLYSESMLSRLAEIEGRPLLLHLHGFRVPFYYEVLNRFGPKKRFPIFLVGHGMSMAPVSELLGLHRPLTYLCLIAEQWHLRRALEYVDVVSEQADSAIREVRRVYSGRIEKLTMGCDFRFWSPVPTEECRTKLRESLGISRGKVVFLSLGNFIPRKQFDRLIESFVALASRRDDFFLLIAGHGDAASTDRLASLMRSLTGQSKGLLHSYLEGVRLRDFYWVSDVYFSASCNEGSSVAVMKAMACGLPVMSTLVGETSERMKRYGVGKFIPAYRYDEWQVAIEEVLDKGLPASLDREIAKETYDWPKVAARFIDLYEDLCRAYFG